MSVPLEDFGRRPEGKKPPAAVSAPIEDAETDATYDRAYNAGWDDAMAQVDAEQGRLGDRLRDRLEALEIAQADAMRSSVSALEPVLHEIFDKLLPRAVERGFLGVLMEEVGTLAADEAGRFTIQVAPEEAPRVTRLLARADLAPNRVTVRPEPALALSQALIRWEANERRIDLESVLGALDDALESFLDTLAPEDEYD
ncbi:flagellar assembly protein FliH [Jannaschia seohaensis]|uniref:Flagellar assembly protein FliH n=2 Tax=Jannaschia seohaensis TaxID=475081 RepID=A0A2Y9ASR9_9RHOB|nr:flagellar assembly protein FliH [Jannaschia seohaensis]SSA47471.1 flagellar assembly protein FliH [Jannaschia seohaensis]